jgi:hypothetical protein
VTITSIKVGFTFKSILRNPKVPLTRTGSFVLLALQRRGAGPPGVHWAGAAAPPPPPPPACPPKARGRIFYIDRGGLDSSELLQWLTPQHPQAAEIESARLRQEAEDDAERRGAAAAVGGAPVAAAEQRREAEEGARESKSR